WHGLTPLEIVEPAETSERVSFSDQAGGWQAIFTRRASRQKTWPVIGSITGQGCCGTSVTFLRR
ncbi:MAG TPA: hypothetical protein VLB68_30900, partial [Pyrinomonadaceae bacterium]|nr:hypothetical protein [Pyrinomonadaceae bacterium]